MSTEINLLIDRGKIDATLANFPVMINLATYPDVWTEITANADRKKLKVKSVGGTEYYVEIESFDTVTETGILWTKIPSVSHTSDTRFILEVGLVADNTTYVSDPGEVVAQSVWDSNFKSVYHMAQDPSGGADCILDSTSNNNDGTPDETMLTEDLVNGTFGKALDFDGSDDSIDVSGSALDIIDAVTVESYARLDDAGGGNFARIFQKGTATTKRIEFWVVSDGECVFRINGGDAAIGSVGSWSLGAYHYFVGRADPTGDEFIRVQADLIELGTKASTVTPNADTDAFIGNWNTAGTRGWNGEIQEVRISDVKRTDAWIKATYYSNIDDLVSLTVTTEKVLTENTGLSVAIELTSFFSNEEFYAILIEAIGLNDAIDRDFYFYRTFAEAVELTDVITLDHYVVELSEAFELEDAIGRDFYFYRTFAEAVELTDVMVSFNWTQWLAQNEYKAIKQYYLTLTGADDSTTDVVLPMKSFQGTLRDGDPTYLSCVIPGVDYSAQINARSNGDLIVEMAYLLDGIEQYKEQLAIVDLETIRIDEGTKNKSITLSGHRTESFVSKNVILDDASYYYISGGEYHYRLAKIDMYLKPGDTVEVNDDSFTIDTVSYFVSVSRQQMDISE